MCGIAGVFRWNGITRSDTDLVKKMNAVQKHRGPDDEGLFSDTVCVLGHRRLAIIDLSEHGHQPFVSDDGRYWLVYNGEIYNYIELRDELRQFGWQFKTKTDTEVLLKAYQHFGKACLPKLNGMFAFAIYDSAEQSLFLVRDRFGIKPLYYAIADSVLYFASEIKALCSVPNLKLSIKYQSLFDYLVFNRTDIYDETFFEEIKRIPKGHYGIFNADGLKITQWWNPENYLNNFPENNLENISDKIQEIFVSAVQLRMRSDVPVGSCLSGGLDSSIMIGILFANNQVQKGYPTFTASFPGHMIDETWYIDALNRSCPFENMRTFPTAEQAYDRLKDFVYANDEPTTNPSFYSQYEVMRLAREYGITVLLDGQGGDENFAGYQYFHGFNLYGLLRQKKLQQFASELLKSIVRKQDISVYQTLVFQILPDSLKKQFLLKTLPYLHPDFFYSYADTSRIYNEFFEVKGLNHSLVRHFQYKLEHLLRMEDRNSMAFSLEARVPYLDYRLVEYVLGISENLKVQAGETKYLQKISLGKYTIPEIMERTDKIGFGTPGNEWMLTEKWRQLTMENYADLVETFPRVFKKDACLPEKGFDRWKVNQLCVWKNIFQ
ncbi:MAG: asparagine synthase (glutamine-hydrolyzing) [Desulfobacteraceae bacterium]|nr:asparagine synthase (glutamine-hydrolyzing) [Desulfobacteraceae bacterium]